MSRETLRWDAPQPVANVAVTAHRPALAARLRGVRRARGHLLGGAGLCGRGRPASSCTWHSLLGSHQPRVHPAQLDGHPPPGYVLTTVIPNTIVVAFTTVLVIACFAIPLAWLLDATSLRDAACTPC